MKRTLNFLLPVLIIATVLYGCKKDHADVPAPVEGLKAYAGKNRAMVEFEVPANATSGKVFYGNGEFVAFTVNDPGAKQAVVVEELPEQEQTLRVVTINSDGITSDPKGVKVKVYGSKYESGLKPRKWADQLDHTASSIQLVFNDAAADEDGVWVVFTHTSGAKDSLRMSNTSNTIDIGDIDTEKPYYYYSVFKPEAESIDEFYSVNVDLKTALMLDFKKSNWAIFGVSDEETGKGAANIIDNDINTSWHSKAGITFPHWISVDMANPKMIDGFYYVNDQGNEKSAKNIRFEVSDDNTNWTVALETEVLDNFLRQRLPLAHSVTARYFKVTVLESWGGPTSPTQFAEIDTYNNQDVSGENGKDAYTTSTAITLVNAKMPFQGDGSNPFPALGDYRMQKLAGWSHNANAVVSYDKNGDAFSLFTAAVWGLSAVTNGKVYQTVSLQPGQYLLKIQVGSADGPVDIYGVVAKNGLPDYTEVASSTSTMKYLDLLSNQNKTVEIVFAVTDATPVNIGVVYNIRDQYGATGTPWSSFNLKGFELFKVE